MSCLATRAKESVIKKGLTKLHKDKIRINKSREVLDNDILKIYRMFNASSKHRINIENNYGLEY